MTPTVNGSLRAVKPSIRVLHKASAPFRQLICEVDISQLRAGFADLMDRCANVVTQEHGLDLDDVIMERSAIVGLADCPNGDCLEVALPFLADQASLVQTIHNSAQSTNASLEFKQLVLHVLLEGNTPVFNQAGNKPDAQ